VRGAHARARGGIAAAGGRRPAGATGRARSRSTRARPLARTRERPWDASVHRLCPGAGYG